MAGLGDLLLTSSMNLGECDLFTRLLWEVHGANDGRETWFEVRGTENYHWLSHLPLASISPSVNGGIVI